MLRYGGIRKHPLIRDIPATMQQRVAKRVCYSKKYNFCYVRIPKAANSSISRTIAAHMPEFSPAELDFIGRGAKRFLRGLPSLAQFHNSYSFAFVRDPANRVLSAWMDKGHNQYFIKKYAMHRKDDPRQPLTFRQFLEALGDGLLDRDPHWAPQSSLLPFKGQSYSFVGKVENLDVQIEAVCREIFGYFNKMENRDVGRTWAASRATHLVEDTKKRMIFKLYEEDYDRFFSDATI